ncbi:hypothetical protein GCM10023093_22090 [Nemorincola caseinilytica]|uniref:Uncharacterized protein n=2 Tax=Nemorincola caseinilytica TaxID=2054315 RepID=A0ABP8NJU9_9BACT
MYGWDQSSWFANQSDDNRNNIIKNLYYAIPCVDNNGHYMFHGRRGTTRYRGTFDTFTYRAETGYGNQQETIKKLWNGDFATPHEWVHHNFTDDQVFNGLHNAASSLIFVGEDKIYFIATDGYIHGYVRYNGTWLGVSPTYAAKMKYGQEVNVPGGQVQAKSDLVASPDGRTLLYIGVDGYIHGFDIIDIWDYRHIPGFMMRQMLWQGLRAECGLIYPANDRVYYIARQGDGTLRVHGFLRSFGAWSLVSPSRSAEDNFAAGDTGQRVMAQFQPAGAPRPTSAHPGTTAPGCLVYDSSTPIHRLYYRTQNGWLAYYEVIDPIRYRYVPCPGNFLLHSHHLAILGKLAVHGNRVYFVSHDLDTGYDIHTRQDRVNCLIDHGGGVWNLISLSYSAQHFYGQSMSGQANSGFDGEIAVSPDGKLIAYFGLPFSFVCLFRNIDGERYKYEGTYPARSRKGDNSLHFRDNDIFYTDRWTEHFIHQLKFEEYFCTNPAVVDFP